MHAAWRLAGLKAAYSSRVWGGKAFRVWGD